MSESRHVDLKALENTPPWEWPKDAGSVIVETLVDRSAPESERVVAAELGGEYVISSDRMSEALLEIVRDNGESAEMRSRAAISLGPALEEADTGDYEDPIDPPSISEAVFRKVKETLRTAFYDANVPKAARRSILEASVRSPQPWHAREIRQAYAGDDEEWRLTAVFCMRFVKGFENEILESLHSKNRLIKYHAVQAAGAWEIDDAWPEIARLVKSPGTKKDLLLVAMEAASAIRPDETDIYEELFDSDDKDIAEAAFEAASGSMMDAGEDFEDDDLEEEEED